LVHGYDDGFSGLFADALVGVRRTGIEVNRIALLEFALVFAVMETQLAIEEIEELEARMHVGFGEHIAGEGNELGEVGVHVAVGDHVAQALKEICGQIDACLGKADPLLAAMNAEEGGGLGLEKVGQVLGKDHGDAGEIAEGGDDAAGFKLGKKAGG
jgi:hypothetical protein